MLPRPDFIELNPKGSFTLGLNIIVFKEGDFWNVYSPAFEHTDCAKGSAEQAKENFKKSLYIVIKQMIKEGTIYNELQKLKWNRVLSTKPKLVHYPQEDYSEIFPNYKEQQLEEICL